MAFIAVQGLSQTSNIADPNYSQYIPLPLRETLKNIPAASVACRKEDFTIKPEGISGKTTRYDRKHDSSCAISLEQLSGFLGKVDTVLVDTRPKSVFDRHHIDSTVNFSVSEIRTKNYLVNKLLVLVGDGKDDQGLYEYCAELRSAGFKNTRVLKGGLHTWLLEGKPVVGTAPTIFEHANLSPAELFQASRVPDNVILGLPTAQKLSDVLPGMINFPLEGQQTIKGLIQKRKGLNAVRNIILVADESLDKNRFAFLAQQAKPDLLFAYTGAEADYRKFLQAQNSMWEKQVKGPTKPRCGG